MIDRDLYSTITINQLFETFDRDIWKMKESLSELDEGSIKNKYLMAYESILNNYGSWIGYSSQFDGKPVFPHGIKGIHISGGAKIGKNCVIFQYVTIGSNTLCDSKGKGAPTIGDNCYIGVGAKIIGNVTIGNNCRIGANWVATKDMLDNSVAVLQPARIIQKENLDNRYYSQRESAWCYYDSGKWIRDDEYEF